MDELTSSTGAQIGRLEIHGPLSEAIAAAPSSSKIDPSIALMADFYDLEEGFFSRLAPDTPDTLCSTQMYLDVADWGKARPIMAQFIDRTTKEPGCLYSG